MSAIPPSQPLDRSEPVGLSQPVEPSEPVDAEPATGPERGARSRLRRIPRLRLVVALTVLVAAVAATATIVAVRASAAGPDDVVRQYLDAIRHRQVDRALNIAGVTRPSGDDGAFLSASAISQDWKVGEVTSRYDSFDDDYRVTAALTLTTGTIDPTWVAVSGVAGDATLSPTTMVGEFSVVRSGSGFRIEDPFVEVAFPASAVPYIEVNGARTARAEPVEPPGLGRPARSYSLFPGFYRLYDSPESRSQPTIAVTPVKLLVPPGAGKATLASPVVVTLTADGVRGFQTAVNAALDACVADVGATRPACVLLGNDFLDYPTVVDRSATNEHWRIVSYPVMTLPLTYVRDLATFELQAAVPAVLEVTFDVHGARVAQTCVTRAIDLYARVAVGGALVTAWGDPASAGGPAKPSRVSLTCEA